MYVFIYYSMNIFAIALFKESEDVIVTMQLLESSDKVEGLILLQQTGGQLAFNPERGDIYTIRFIFRCVFFALAKG